MGAIAILISVLYGVTWYLYPNIGTKGGLAYMHLAIWSYGIPLVLTAQLWLVSISAEEKSEKGKEILEFSRLVCAGLVALLVCLWCLFFYEYIRQQEPTGIFFGLMIIFIMFVMLFVGLAAVLGYFVLHAAAAVMIVVWIKQTIIGIHYLFVHHPAEYLMTKQRFTVLDAKQLAQLFQRMRTEKKEAPYAFVSENEKRRVEAMTEKIKSETELGNAVVGRVRADAKKGET